MNKVDGWGTNEMGGERAVGGGDEKSKILKVGGLGGSGSGSRLYLKLREDSFNGTALNRVRPDPRKLHFVQ